MSIQGHLQVVLPPNGAHGYMNQQQILKTQFIINLLFINVPIENLANNSLGHPIMCVCYFKKVKLAMDIP